MQKATKRTKIIDLTEFGELRDACPMGYMSFANNLASAIMEALSMKNPNKAVFDICVSKVDFSNRNDPYRYSAVQQVTLRQLKNARKRERGEPFNEESYQKCAEEQAMRRYSHEKEGQRRAAW